MIYYQYLFPTSTIEKISRLFSFFHDLRQGIDDGQELFYNVLYAV